MPACLPACLPTCLPTSLLPAYLPLACLALFFSVRWAGLPALVYPEPSPALDTLPTRPCRPGAGLHMRLGYTALMPAGLPQPPGQLWGGTVDARLCLLDCGSGQVVSEWLACSSLCYDADEAIRALCQSGACLDSDDWASGGSGGGLVPGFGASQAGSSHTPGWLQASAGGNGGGQGGTAWLAAGNKRGRVTVVDARCGLIVMSWQAHDLDVCSLAAWGHMLASASADRSLKVWDLRKGVGRGGATGGWAGAGWQANGWGPGDRKWVGVGETTGRWEAGWVRSLSRHHCRHHHCQPRATP